MSRNNPVKTNLPATGQVGTPPPPGAPIETSQPLQPDAGGIVFVDRETGARTVMHPMDRARQNERELQPLVFANAGLPAGGDRQVERTGVGGTGAHSTGGVAEAVSAARDGQLDPFYARLEKQGPEAIAAIGAGPVGASAPTIEPPANSGSRILKRRSSMPAVTGTGAPVAVGATAGAGAVTAAIPQDSLASAPAINPAVVSTDGSTSAAGEGARTGLAASDGQFHPPADDDAAAHLTPEELELQQTAAELAALQKTHPAASNSDSPSRGMPRRSPREGLDIKGGWGDANVGSQYFALSGDELKVVCQQLLRDIDERLDNDLRFSIALTYPRVSVRATLQIHGFAGGPQSFDIERVRPADVPTNDRSPYPQELAEALADEIMFVVIAERREVDNDGESVAAPDQLREEFGLQRPGKRAVAGTMGVHKRLTDIS